MPRIAEGGCRLELCARDVLDELEIEEILLNRLPHGTPIPLGDDGSPDWQKVDGRLQRSLHTADDLAIESANWSISAQSPCSYWKVNFRDDPKTSSSRLHFPFQPSLPFYVSVFFRLLHTDTISVIADAYWSRRNRTDLWTLIGVEAGALATKHAIAKQALATKHAEEMSRFENCVTQLKTTSGLASQSAIMPSCSTLSSSFSSSSNLTSIIQMLQD